MTLLAPDLAALRALGVIRALDEHVARTLGRLAGDDRPAVLAAVAAVSRATADGHVCLRLARVAGQPVAADPEDSAPLAGRWPGRAAWLSELASSPLVGGPHDFTPLVLGASERLYLRRYWQLEAALAGRIRARLSAPDLVVAQAPLCDALERLFPCPAGAAESHPARRLRDAARSAALRPLVVLTGGPGSGKTTAVVRILALLAELARATGAGLPRVALLAPTGKAAARLAEAVRQARAGLPCAAEVRDALPTEAATVHRALGSLPHSRTRFRHDEAHPLPADVVVVDEASMLDLALAARLTAAVRPDARLLLVGDPDQLASVEAGAVLGQLALDPRSAAAPTGTGPTEPPAAAATAAPEPLRSTVVPLTGNYRFAAAPGISAVATAIRAGDRPRALAALCASATPDVRLVPLPAGGQLPPELLATALAGFDAIRAASDGRQRQAALGRFRILCALRRGPFGLDAVNAAVERALGATGRLRGPGRFYPGQPLIVKANDYALGLFNGDVGLVAALADPAGGRTLYAEFIMPDGELRRISPARLPPHDTAFALTVHQSQGSEFDEVALLLPDRDNPLLTCELLYTALTRARARVVVYGDPQLVAEALGRRVDRDSGLADALRAPPDAA